jgi:hypothetical protein
VGGLKDGATPSLWLQAAAEPLKPETKVPLYNFFFLSLGSYVSGASTVCKMSEVGLFCSLVDRVTRLGRGVAGSVRSDLENGSRRRVN